MENEKITSAKDLLKNKAPKKTNLMGVVGNSLVLSEGILLTKDIANYGLQDGLKNNLERIVSYAENPVGPIVAVSALAVVGFIAKLYVERERRKRALPIADSDTLEYTPKIVYDTENMLQLRVNDYNGSKIITYSAVALTALSSVVSFVKQATHTLESLLNSLEGLAITASVIIAYTGFKNLAKQVMQIGYTVYDTFFKTNAASATETTVNTENAANPTETTANTESNNNL